MHSSEYLKALIEILYRKLIIQYASNSNIQVQLHNIQSMQQYRSINITNNTPKDNNNNNYSHKCNTRNYLKYFECCR